MTKKDYELIAAALKVAGDHAGSAERTDQHRRDCSILAAELASENPRFDRARFLKAAGVAS